MIAHLEVGRSAYFYRTRQRITNAAIEALFRNLRASARQPSQNLFQDQPPRT